jgi:folate-dependent phosphoribosylglycinamide formyltransferase PurN
LSGCTVHLVDAGVDTGPIIAQGVVPVLEDDTSDTLQQRILAMEHQVYPAVLRWIAEGRLSHDRDGKLSVQRMPDERRYFLSAPATMH